MAEVTGNIIQGFATFSSSLTPTESLVVAVISLSILLTIIALFIWEFYKSISQKNLIKLNLRKYNYSDHSVSRKVIASVFYLLEYLIIMPVLIILWFTALSIVLLVIARELPIDRVLLISAVIITSARILAYRKRIISEDIAKLFPLMVLSIFLLSPGALDIETVLARLSEIPVLLNQIVYYILIITLIEVILRIFYTMYEFWRTEDEKVSFKD
jgi:hypothetical protein